MFDIYKTFMKTWFVQNLQYRLALLIWLIGFILEPVVYLVVWSTVAQSRGGVTGSFTPPELATYFTAVMLINHLTFDWHFFEIEPRVRNGGFSPLLLRPLHPIHSDLADNMVYKLMTFPFIFAAAVSVFFSFGARLNTPGWAALLLIPVMIQAFLMRFILEWTLSLTAFWTTRVQAIVTVYITLGIFLSGRMAPLELLPAWIQSIAMALPFRLWISFPVELLLGRLTPEMALINFGMQTLWITGLFVVFRIVWRQGMKRYSAVGA